MNHFAARNRLTDRRWDFTCREGVGSRTRPVGYCAGWSELSDDTIAIVYGTRENPNYIREETRRRAFRDKYHLDGHATRAEACACYREYLLDNFTILKFAYSSSSSCRECGDSTPYAARVGNMVSIALCLKHNDAERVRRHMPDVDEFYEA